MRHPRPSLVRPLSILSLVASMGALSTACGSSSDDVSFDPGSNDAGGVGGAGISGSSGSNNTGGVSGESGTAGSSTNGANGSSGTSGSNGSSGSSGTSGANGTSGTAGSSVGGSSGANGANGTAGAGDTGGTGGAGTAGDTGTGGAGGIAGTDAIGGSSGASAEGGTAGTDVTGGSAGTAGTDAIGGAAGTAGAGATSGTSGTAGTVATPVCGNSMTEAGEECDDGNTIDTDSCVACKNAFCGDGFVGPGEQCDSTAGCDSSCQLVTVVAADACPGTPASLAPGVLVLSGTTASATGNFNGCDGGASKDVVYAVTPTVNGVLSAVLTTTNYNGTLSAETVCGQTNSQIACDSAFQTAPRHLSLPVYAGTTYYILVDGYGFTDQSGAFTLKLALDELTPACTLSDIDPNSGMTNNNTPGVAQVAPAACTSFAVVNGDIQDGQDEDDWYRFTAAAGASVSVTATYVVNNQITCSPPGGNNVVIELFKGTQTTTATNNDCANNVGSLACAAGNGDCPSFTTTVSTAGEYLVHVYDRYKNGNDPAYAIFVTTN